MGKWDNSAPERRLRGIFFTLKPQPWPNRAKTHLGTSVQAGANHIAEMFFIMLTTPVIVTCDGEFTSIFLLNVFHQESISASFVTHVILVKLSAPQNTQPIVSTALQACMLNYINCPISYHLGYRFHFMGYETSVKIITQWDREALSMVSLVFLLVVVVVVFLFCVCVLLLLFSILSVSLLHFLLGRCFSHRAKFPWVLFTWT